ncbi:hypothetical protein [Streptomyces scopuliridis]|uniref:hypothetical protein n=1 Tax=Streptomyces scopuliridis TaxID=452529 RepID=UPI0036BA9B94
MLFAALLIRRPLRLRNLRRLATAQAGPGTRTFLPGSATTVGPWQNLLPPLPAAFRLATPRIDPSPAHDQQREREELAVRAWLHQDQHGRTDTVLPGPGVLAEAEQRSGHLALRVISRPPVGGSRRR